MMPLEKIEHVARRLYQGTSQCGKAKRELRKNRDEFVKNVIQNSMVDGFVIRCKK
jgi:hypothetical protein